MTLFVNNYFLIKKKLKFLIEISLEADGKFKVHDKLALIFTQSGLYEFEKLQSYIRNYFSSIEIYSKNIIEIKILTSILIIFSKKQNKTLIFIFNSFNKNFLKNLFKLLAIEFYLKQKNKFFINLLNNNFNKKIFNLYYLNYLKKILKLNKKKSKKRFVYNYFIKNKYLEFEFSWKLKWKIFKLKKKWKLKKKKQLKKKKFMYIIKTYKWLNYFIFLKIIILKTIFFNNEFTFLNNKLFFYNLLFFFIHYKKKFKKLFRRRFYFKKKYSRDRYGEVFKNLKIEYKKKKK